MKQIESVVTCTAITRMIGLSADYLKAAITKKVLTAISNFLTSRIEEIIGRKTIHIE